MREEVEGKKRRRRRRVEVCRRGRGEENKDGRRVEGKGEVEEGNEGL